jgi:crotonobetainyl-CoA:carnitine CoA-transferase CaiB-like acyl-CoA transferase
VKTRLHFDYETLKPRNPRLVYASISAFGQDGPYKDKPGLMSVTGEPGRGPMRVGIAISDIVTGRIADVHDGPARILRACRPMPTGPGTVT